MRNDQAPQGRKKGSTPLRERFPQIYFPDCDEQPLPTRWKAQTGIMRADVRERFKRNDPQNARAKSLFRDILRVTNLESIFCVMTFPKIGTKSLFRKILRATILESRFCRHKCIPQARNSNESKILEKVIEK